MIAMGRWSLSGINVDCHRGGACIACQKFRHSRPDCLTLCSQHQIKRYFNRACFGPCPHPIGLGNEPQAFRFQQVTHSGPGKSLCKPLPAQTCHLGSIGLGTPLTGEQG